MASIPGFYVLISTGLWDRWIQRDILDEVFVLCQKAGFRFQSAKREVLTKENLDAVIYAQAKTCTCLRWLVPAMTRRQERYRYKMASSLRTVWICCALKPVLHLPQTATGLFAKEDCSVFSSQRSVMWFSCSGGQDLWVSQTCKMGKQALACGALPEVHWLLHHPADKWRGMLPEVLRRLAELALGQLLHCCLIITGNHFCWAMSDQRFSERRVINCR